MTTFLLTISLLLNGITIFSIIVLFTRQNRFLEVEKTQKKMVKEMEEIISTYLVEMKAENEAFIDRFHQLNQSSSAKGSLKKKPVSNLKGSTSVETFQQQKNDGVIENEWTQKAGMAFKQQAVKAYKSFADPTPDHNLSSISKEKENEPADRASAESVIKKDPPLLLPDERSRNLTVSQIEEWQKQGLSTEEIAKTLKRGKTEIELLLKFK